MENPFEEKSNTILIAALAAGALTAGAIAYLYLTESGDEIRKGIKHKFLDEIKDIASGFISNKTGVHKDTVKGVADHFVK